MNARRLGMEFVLFFLLAPVLGAVVLPASYMFAMLFGMTLLGLVLLARTPGFHWRELLNGARAATHPGLIAGFAMTVLVICWGVVRIFAPEAEFFLIRENPRLMLMIATLYPLVSALPQEIIYRALYFRRYGALLPSGQAGLWLNAGVFSLAHLMYWNWLVLIMTLAGGFVFAWAYRQKDSFPLALVLHALAGVILFAVGLGVFFYSGNVTRPF